MRLKLQLNKALRMCHQKPILVHAAQTQFTRLKYFFLLKCWNKDIIKTHLLVLIN